MSSSTLSPLTRCLRGVLLFVGCTVAVQTAHAQPTDISATLKFEADATYQTRAEEYKLPDVNVGLDPADGVAFPTAMAAVVVAPVNATGALPVAMFIHGQAPTCYNPTTGEGSRGQCVDGLQPFPSYRGYLTFQNYLAARGWITVSIDANPVSAGPFAESATSDPLMRASLVEAHLRQWAAWANKDNSVPAPALLAGITPDLQRLMLIGHSRGGSASNQVALRSVTNSGSLWRVRAQVLIGPVEVQHNPAPSVPVVVLLPGCDGDVSDLQGQGYIDRARDLGADSVLRSAVFIDHANHNFFNSEWDPSSAVAKGAAKDDASELFPGGAPAGSCAPGAAQRLSGDAQRALGSLFIAAAGKALVLGDTTVLPLLDGSDVCAGPSCSTSVHTAAIGGGHQPLLIPQIDTQASSDAITVTPCLTSRNRDAEGGCIDLSMPIIRERPRTPHFGSALDLPAGSVALEPSSVALAMNWSSPNRPVASIATAAALSPQATAVAVRVIVAPEDTNTSFELALRDSAGKTLPLGFANLSGLPASAGAGTGTYWAQEARFAIDPQAVAQSGFDINSVASLNFTALSANGRVWLLDVWGYVPGQLGNSGSAARFEISPKPATLQAGQLSIEANIFGSVQGPAEIYYYFQPGLEGRVAVNTSSGSFLLSVAVPTGPDANLSQIQLLGVKGMVAGKRMDVVILPSAEPTEPTEPTE